MDSSRAFKGIDQLLPISGVAVLAILFCVLIGRLVSVSSIASSSEISVREDTRASVQVERVTQASQEKVIEVTVPTGMRFVASRKGEKYYPIESAMAERLVPKNRIYFESAEKAERAGYRK